MKKILVLSLAIFHLLLLGCDRPAPVDDLDRQEEVPVDDTFEPVPTEIP